MKYKWLKINWSFKDQIYRDYTRYDLIMTRRIFNRVWPKFPDVAS